MKVVLAFVSAAACMVGAAALGSLLLFLAGMCLIIYGLVEGLDGMK